MKFQPQIVTCPICGRQHQIITEDIPSRNIYVCRKLVNPGLRLCVLLECPECYHRFELRFEEKSNFNNETMFECTGCMNAGLQMWKRIEGSSIITPSYQPNVGNRTALEQKLDGKALAKVNRITDLYKINERFFARHDINNINFPPFSLPHQKMFLTLQVRLNTN